MRENLTNPTSPLSTTTSPRIRLEPSLTCTHVYVDGKLRQYVFYHRQTGLWWAKHHPSGMPGFATKEAAAEYVAGLEAFR